MNKVTLFVWFAFAAIVSGRQGFGPGQQEWGFVDVREDAHIFWWLYYSRGTADYTDSPLIIWLQGGPGASSTGYGNFAELGPLDADLNPRNHTWVNRANVLFVDNPVGTGFSYVDNDSAYTTTNRQIADDFLAFVKGFYKQNPEFSKTPLYILCESYGGKMTAEIALVLYEAIQNKELDIVFNGVGLGDSWISPVDSVITWAPYLLQLGAIDSKQFNNIEKAANLSRDAANAGKWTDATNYWSYTEGVIMQETDNIDFYNVLTKISSGFKFSSKKSMIRPLLKDDEEDEDAKINEIMVNQVTKALNISIPGEWNYQAGSVFDKLNEDFMKPVTSIVESLLNDTTLKVVVYNGQLDLIVDLPGTVKWIDELNWYGSEDWANAEKHGFVVDGIYEGYIKGAGKSGRALLQFFWVNRAGHMVPADNPQAMNYILDDLTSP